MNEIRSHIYDLLKADAALTTLATGGVHFRMAPEGTAPPLVIFDKYVPERLDLAFAGPDLEWDQWLVRGVGAASTAEDIDKRCQVLLNGADFSMKDYELLYCRRIGGVSYPELVGGDRYDHIGSIYQVGSEQR